MTAGMKTAGNTTPDARKLLRDRLEAVRPDLVSGFDAGNLSEGNALVFALLGASPKDEADAGEVDATEAARMLAAANNIDLADVEGTGVNGRIIVDDVQAAIDARE